MLITPEQLLQLLRREIERRGSQIAVANALGISGAYLSDILNGQREPGAKVLTALGLRRIVRYERVEKTQ